MPIVDLRGREDEPEVRELLAPQNGWIVVGWRDAEGLAACAGLERTSDAELAIRGLGSRDEAAAQALLDDLARVATASRLVADGAEGTAGIYLRSGFTREKPGGERYVRSLEEQPAAHDTTVAISLAELESAIRRAWARDTSDDPDEWSPANPARGQCAVTALLVRELLGGEILVANVLRDGRRVERHAWNRLPSGLSLDLTRDQFASGESLGEPAVEEPALTHRHPERFAALRSRVHAELGLDT